MRPSEETTVTINQPGPENIITIDENIKALLGDIEFHEEIFTRWDAVLKNGQSAENKKKENIPYIRTVDTKWPLIK